MDTASEALTQDHWKAILHNGAVRVSGTHVYEYTDMVLAAMLLPQPLTSEQIQLLAQDKIDIQHPADAANVPAVIGLFHYNNPKPVALMLLREQLLHAFESAVALGEDHYYGLYGMPKSREEDDDKAYKLEEDFLNKHAPHLLQPIARIEIDHLIGRICEHYDVNRPWLTILSKEEGVQQLDDGDPKGGTFGMYKYGDDIEMGTVILVDGWFDGEKLHGLSTSTVIHEMAHFLMDECVGEVPDHGSQFFKKLAELYAHFTDAPAAFLVEEGLKNGLIPSRKIQPPALRAFTNGS